MRTIVCVKQTNSPYCKQQTDITVSSNVWQTCYMQCHRMVSVCVLHFDLQKLPKSNLTNANILCLVQFGSGRNK